MRETVCDSRSPTTATMACEFLSSQSQFDLAEALKSGGAKAVETIFWFRSGWARGDGGIGIQLRQDAEGPHGADWAITFSPRNAEAWALKGFL